MRRFVVIALVLFLAYSCSQKTDSVLTIATSANMQYAMEELVEAFEAESGIRVDLVISSSGKLTAQIIAGAPYDLFFSADTKFPERLYAERLTKGEPQIYAYGKLVRYTSLDSAYIFSQENIPQDFKIAIANPKTAPYGQAAIEYLKAVGNYEDLEQHLVFGESVAQVNQFLTSGVAEMGFTAKSVMFTQAFKNKGHWREIESRLYDPIAQSMVRLNQGNSSTENIEAFFNFILSAEGQEILKRFGYDTIH